MRSTRRRVIGSMLVAAVIATAGWYPAASASAGSPRTEAVQSIGDAVGDSEHPQGDITSASVRSGADGTTTLSVQVATFESPFTANWQDGATGAAWAVELDGDDLADFYVLFLTELIGGEGEVVAEVHNTATDAVACEASPSWDAAQRTYTASFATTCIDNPVQYRWAIEMKYDNGATGQQSVDFAPDAGWSAPVHNDAVDVPSLTPCTPGTIGPPGPASDGFVPLVPARLMDTRAGMATIDCRFAGTGSFGGTAEAELTVAGRGGVPAGATAVVLNVTATEAGAAGFVTVYPCGTARPMTSNVNFTAGSTVPNAVIATLGAGGTTCLFSNTTVHLVVDVNGYFTAGSSYQTFGPDRAYDSRDVAATAPAPPLPAGAVVEVGVPAGGSAAVINVTVTEPETAGFATVFPCGATPPLASNVNFRASATVANAVVAKAGTDGKACIYLSTAAHVVVDVFAYFDADAGVQSLVPARLLDTRPGMPTFDGAASGGGVAVGSSVLELQVAGRANVPVGAAAVVLNVTVDDMRGSGFVTVFPCGVQQPNASSLNATTGSTVANAVITQVGSGGTVCFYTNVSTHLVVDVNGYYPAT